ncbi:BLOC-1-related complex subunit 6 [Pectinophora gossypiella]|uniref:BLOC-1-related complex subunit 6 C-terminal helix domain-containing protein n=1 Tax=Pectinophora gossypiella TaxID=13191 RepID=A0A1E1WD51_PECGO|nr:BLOC-1-related complex subunit 6 [Pectinophora gossypiella]
MDHNPPEPMSLTADEIDPEETQHKQQGDIDRDIDEEISARMTASYSEISFHSDHGQSSDDTAKAAGPSRPYDLPSENRKQEKIPLNIDGHVRYEGDMTHYVADDLEFKIKLSSPITKRGETPVFGSNSASRSSTPSGKLYRQILAPQIGQIDITVLNDLEYEAQKIAQSVDNLIENLSSILHSNSSLTADNMEVYKDAVGKTCDAMDNNIKSMYTILAKGEEVSQAMVPVQAQAARIAEIKRLLQVFENNF